MNNFFVRNLKGTIGAFTLLLGLSVGSTTSSAQEPAVVIKKKAPKNTGSKHNEAREIKFHAEKIEGKVTWLPSKVEVKPGESVKFVVEYTLEGGFDFHGFSIPVLQIVEKVDRNKPLTKEVTIPAGLKEGEYPVICQFHPAHVGAKLVVKK